MDQTADDDISYDELDNLQREVTPNSGLLLRLSYKKASRSVAHAHMSRKRRAGFCIWATNTNAKLSNP